MSTVVAVAYSAGRDSTALLHATLRAAAERGDVRVAALHVHHGLSAQANDWLALASQQCDAWAAAGLPVQFSFRRLSLQVQPGESLEAVARTARYAALAEMAREQGAEMVLLAHHQRDQAETLLLQALRGGGLAGMAAMPVEIDRAGIQWVRPWLRHGREAIEAYVDLHQLRYVDDDSNTDQRYARNRLRLSVWPALTQAFDHAETALAHAASRAADAQACLAEWADQKLASIAMGEGAGRVDLDAAQLIAEGLPMQRELLRHWFAQCSQRTMPSSLVARLTEELPRLLAQGRPGHWPAGLWTVSLYKGLLRCEPRRADASVHAVASVSINLSEPGIYPVPQWNGSLHVLPCDQGGVTAAALRQAELRSREGGEGFQLAGNRPVRALRKQYQSEHVPAWERLGPLVYGSSGQLLFVPGLGMDARAWAKPDDVQFVLHWVPQRTV